MEGPREPDSDNGSEEPIDPHEFNEYLEHCFAKRNLNPWEIMGPASDEVEMINRQLLYLLEWVETWEHCKDREAMKSLGFDFPPSEPDLDPEADWLRFELWVNGQPTAYNLRERLPKELFVDDVASLTDEDAEKLLEQLVDVVRVFDVEVDYYGNLPAKLAYMMLTKSLDTSFDVLESGTWHLDGCDGFCPGCLQRPWCQSGMSCFEEDEVAGIIVYPEAVLAWVSPTPFSLSVLQQEGERESVHRFGLEDDDSYPDVPV